MTVPMTIQGHKKLQEELNHLIRVERPKAITAIEVARGHGDLSENAEYDAARDHQGFIEGRISEIQGKLAVANVIDTSKLSGDRVVFGAQVTLYDVDADKEVSYMIVGEDEADIKDGRISVISPVAKALIGRSIDDEVTVATPAGQRCFEVLSVKFN